VSHAPGWRGRSPSIFTDGSAVSCKIRDQRFKQRGIAMQALSATAAATVILYFADQYVFDGRHAAVVTGMLRQFVWLVGIHV
jgi:hypothetical protein